MLDNPIVYLLHYINKKLCFSCKNEKLVITCAIIVGFEMGFIYLFMLAAIYQYSEIYNSDVRQIKSGCSHVPFFCYTSACLKIVDKQLLAYIFNCYSGEGNETEATKLDEAKSGNPEQFIIPKCFNISNW